MQSNLEGYIISVKRYKDKDSIINILTSEGIITIFGRSYRSPKSKYHVLNNLFLKVNIIGDKKNKFILRNFDIVDYSLVNSFNYDEVVKLTKIINLLKKNEVNNERIYLYFTYIINNVKKDNNENFLYWIIAKILEENNIILNFEKCVSCSSKENIINFSMYDGGLLCYNCNYLKNNKTFNEIKMINLLFNGKIKHIENIRISKEIKKEIEQLLNESLGLYIKE